jgi:hypothetical protein
MKVPANMSGDRLILDYLTRVTVAGTRYLPKGSRIAFVGQTRNRIEREIGPNGPADPAHVQEVLTKLGEPEDLVRAERARLDAERASRQSRVTGVGGADAATGTGAIEARRINSRWRPATRAHPARPPAAGGEGAGPRDRSAGRRGAAGDGKRKGRLGGLLKDRPGPEPQAPPGAQAPPADAARSPAGTAGLAPEGTVRPVPDGAAGQAPDSPAGQVPDGSARQAPGGTASQAAGGPGRWPTAGAGGQAPGGTGSPPPDTTGTQPLRGRTGTQPAGATGTQAPGGTGTRSWPETGTRSSREPGTRSSPETGTHAPGEAGAGGSPPGSGADGGESPPLGPNGWLMPTAVIPPGAGARQTRRGGPSGGDTPVHGIPVLRPGTRAPREPLTARTAAAATGRGAARLAVSAAGLARRYPLETAAVTVLALGGFILPFPYWLFGGLLGGVLSIWSRMWLARDKWIAVFGPLVVVIVGTILAAVITGGHGGAVTAYPHAFVAYAGNLLRFGNVLCAAYLVVQARRAPQRRLPPWQRQRQRPPRYR